jgi:hypothetical protein
MSPHREVRSESFIRAPALRSRGWMPIAPAPSLTSDETRVRHGLAGPGQTVILREAPPDALSIRLKDRAPTEESLRWPAGSFPRAQFPGVARRGVPREGREILRSRCTARRDAAAPRRALPQNDRCFSGSGTMIIPDRQLNYAPAKAGGIGWPLKAAGTTSRLKPAESPGAASPLKPRTETPSRVAASQKCDTTGFEIATSGLPWARSSRTRALTAR